MKDLDLSNNAYQENTSSKEILPLTSFLESVQVGYGIGKKGKREKFDPYTTINHIKQYSLNEALENIEKLKKEEDEEDEDLDDIGDVETDSDESPEDRTVDDDSNEEPEVDAKGTEVTDADIDNETDPEEGRIVGNDGEVVNNIFIGPGQRYFMGASTDPQMVIVSKVSDDYVWFNSFPFKKAEKIKKDIAADLFTTGSNTWLKDPKSKSDEDLRSSIQSVLGGKPGERVSLDDYQFSSIQVKYTGEKTGDLEPWKELESEYDVIVDSNLTNKQTYNLRMNNKQLEHFRSHLQEKPVAERNFKVVRIVTEERQYMIEAISNPVPKAVKREITPLEKEEIASSYTSNIGAGYGAEGFVAGDCVIYEKKKWNVLDFIPFGDKMTVVIVDKDFENIVEFVNVKDIKKVSPEKENDVKPKTYSGKKAEGKPVDVTPKDKKLDFPVSDLKTGETASQKSLKEDIQYDEKKANELYDFIKKDTSLIKNRYDTIIKNLNEKRKNGSYDSNLVEKAFRVLVDEGASKYFNENEKKLLGDEYSSAQEMFSVDVRNKISKRLKDDFEANVEMGNMDESVYKKINEIVNKAESIISEQNKEGIVFTSNEKAEFKKFNNVDISVENIATYSWDKNTRDYKVSIIKKPRKATSDIVYSASTTVGSNNEIDRTRTMDSEPFKTQEDLPILRDFLSRLNLNEETTEDPKNDSKIPVGVSGNAKVYGKAKVSGKAKVYGKAHVFMNALIYGNAQVFDDTNVFGNAKVFDYARIENNAEVYGNAKVYGKAKVSSNAQVFGKAHVFMNALIYGNAQVFDDASVFGNAKVYDNARIESNAEVYGDAKVYGKAKVSSNAQVFGTAKVNKGLVKDIKLSNLEQCIKAGFYDPNPNKNKYDNSKIEDDSLDEGVETVDLTGLADKKKIHAKDVHPEQLIMGIKTEMEHTGDMKVARKIALDHLAEFPQYYTELKKMEDHLKKVNKGSKEKSNG